MNKKRIVIIFILLTVLITAGGVALLSGSSTSVTISTSQNAKVTVDNLTYDWGEIDYNGGNVTKTFVIKNTGTDILKLTKAKTSCHCTKAQITIDSAKSPYFGMNSVSSWVGEVPPGNEAQLNIVFDPAYHGPNGVGPITRYISVDTNDPNNSTLEFTLTANVTK